MLVTNVNSAEVSVSDGSYTSGVQVTLCITDAELATLLAAYDPASGTSPSAALCRPIVRAILDAALEAGIIPPV
jgi:hypothetical protein